MDRYLTDLTNATGWRGSQPALRTSSINGECRIGVGGPIRPPTGFIAGGDTDVAARAPRERLPVGQHI